MPRAIWKDSVIAESEQTQQVEGNHYFPPDSLNRDLLKPSDTNSFCGWKGTANYYTVVVDGEENVDAAWYYADPKPEASHIKDHVAFWKGVIVEDDPA